MVSRAEGWFSYTDVEKIGIAGIHLGAGRKFQGDELDPSAGIEIFRSQGERIGKGIPLFRLHHSGRGDVNAAIEALQQSYKITPAPESPPPLIHKVLK
ncbi:MAG: hypothetical protein HC902_13500 [Calothrix sp. SM1_5_4]|nr:hypothetical protein [Calothrix sp. SM1_5_4]